MLVDESSVLPPAGQTVGRLFTKPAILSGVIGAAVGVLWAGVGMLSSLGALSLAHVRHEPSLLSEFVTRTCVTFALIGWLCGFFVYHFWKSPRQPALSVKVGQFSFGAVIVGAVWYAIQPPYVMWLTMMHLQPFLGVDRTIRLVVITASLVVLFVSSPRRIVLKGLAVPACLRLGLRSIAFAFFDIDRLKYPWALIDAIPSAAGRDAAIPFFVSLGVVAYRRWRSRSTTSLPEGSAEM